MTIDKDGLASLLERVREAKGPDHDLSRAVCLAAGMECVNAWWSWPDDPASYAAPPHVTASIDASLALVERLLSGRRNGPLLYHRRSEWSAHALESDAFTVRLAVAFGDGPDMRIETFEAFGPSEPLATITCLLTALEASNE